MNIFHNNPQSALFLIKSPKPRVNKRKTVNLGNWNHQIFVIFALKD